MKILYTIGVLVAIIVIAGGVMSLSGDKTVTDILIPQANEQQDKYEDNTGDVVGGLPQEKVVEVAWQVYKNPTFEVKYPINWEAYDLSKDSTQNYPQNIIKEIVVISDPEYPYKPESSSYMPRITVRVETDVSACAGGSQSTLANRNIIDTGWSELKFDGDLHYRTVCFPDRRSTIVRASARKGEQAVVDAMINSINFPYIPKG